MRNKTDATRRGFLRRSALASLSLLAAPGLARAARNHQQSAGGQPAGGQPAGGQPAGAEAALRRLLGAHAEQIHLELIAADGQSADGQSADGQSADGQSADGQSADGQSADGPEQFAISGSQGHIEVQGSSPSSLLMGVNWYLKYVAGVSITWNGDSLNRLPSRLPAPSATIRRTAGVAHRFALNDTNDGYTGPYWTWKQWEHFLDVLAIHGINEVLVYAGAEAVYLETLRRFHYSAAELRAWLPTPAHQPWWLLDNLSGWVGPSVSEHLIRSRLELGSRIAGRLRELGMTPVLPGYYGIVPDKFAERNRGAHTVPQGIWNGMRRPDWLDPTSKVFPEVAREFYRVQQKLFGPSTMFKMDPLHEGGKAGDINLEQAAASIGKQLDTAHPGATWAILGWGLNPRPEILAAFDDKRRFLILDGMSDRYAYKSRETQWDHTPYTFGSIWNFGGHTTIGANCGVWNQRYFHQLGKKDSALAGIAAMPEASCNNPAAFALLTELAWRRKPLDLSRWFREWAAFRYGGSDENAAGAWDVLHSTAYSMPSGKWSEAHDNLFSAQPSLTAKSACVFSPKEARYDLQAFRGAIGRLLQVSPSLRNSSAYHYDLVDVARQTLANRSRILLPKLNSAYLAKDVSEFRRLQRQWLDAIAELNRVVGANSSFLLGPWVAAAEAAGRGAAEQEQLKFDARSLLAEWGPTASNAHDYANREWNGMLEFYHGRWSRYFAALDRSLTTGAPAEQIDWFAVDQTWSKTAGAYPQHPLGDPFAVVSGVDYLREAPGLPTADSLPGMTTRTAKTQDADSVCALRNRQDRRE